MHQRRPPPNLQRLAAPLRVRLWCGAPAAVGQSVAAEAGALRVEGGPALRAAPPDAAAAPQRGPKHANEHLLAAFKVRSCCRSLPSGCALAQLHCAPLTPPARQSGYVAHARVAALRAGGYVDVEVTLQLPVRPATAARIAVPGPHPLACLRRATCGATTAS